MFSNSTPLQGSEKGIDNASNEQAYLNQHRWRVPGFLIGIVLAVAGVGLIIVGSSFIEAQIPKIGIGLFWLGIGGIVEFCGLFLMFIVAPGWL